MMSREWTGWGILALAACFILAALYQSYYHFRLWRRCDPTAPQRRWRLLRQVFEYAGAALLALGAMVLASPFREKFFIVGAMVMSIAVGVTLWRYRLVQDGTTGGVPASPLVRLLGSLPWLHTRLFGALMIAVGIGFVFALMGIPLQLGKAGALLGIAFGLLFVLPGLMVLLGAFVKSSTFPHLASHPPSSASPLAGGDMDMETLLQAEEARYIEKLQNALPPGLGTKVLVWIFLFLFGVFGAQFIWRGILELMR